MNDQARAILKRLERASNPAVVAGMARFGIDAKNAYGVPVPILRQIAKETGKNHILAQRLWSSGIHEARILASMVDSPRDVTAEQMEEWVKEFDSWGICDQCCGNLFDKTAFACQKALEWSGREEEFVKRAGFVLMAALAVHDKNAKDETFTKFFPTIKRESVDDRNFVRKSVNWALRQIGKRNENLNVRAMATAREIRKMDSKSAKWIASDAIRELRAWRERAAG